MAKNIHKLTADYIIRRLHEQSLYYFDIVLFAHLFGVSRLEASQIFKRLKRRELICEVEKGKYLLLGFEPQRVLSEPFFIATRLVQPSYISFWSSLNFYGFTEQTPRTVLVVTTRKKNGVIFGDMRFKYIKLSSHKFFGYQEIRSGDLSYLMADKEKAIVDALDLPRYSGGIAEIFKCMYQGREETEVEKLMEYALRVNNKSLNSRLGYLLSKLGIEARGLRANISLSFVRLDPSKSCSRQWNKEWKVNVNLSEEELFKWREIW